MIAEFDEYPPKLKAALDNVVYERQFLGYYSVNRDGNYLSNMSELKYYKDPKTNTVHFDLNKGIETGMHDLLEEDPHNIIHLLEWIKLHYQSIKATGRDSWIQPKFVCSNGLLGKVMHTLSSPKESYIVCAAKWKGTIYLRRYDAFREDRSNQNQKYSYWGMKFEHYLGSDAPDKVPETSKSVEIAEFRWILRCQFGDHSVLISGELDALDSNRTIENSSDLNDHRFVELKTCKSFETAWDQQKFVKFKLPQWWAQCFLANNTKVVCGFRDNDGIVHRLESYSLPNMVEKSQGYLDPLRSVNECRAFLDLVAQNVVDDCDKTIYKFEKKANSRVPVIEKVLPQSKYDFLPSSYLAATG